MDGSDFIAMKGFLTDYKNGLYFNNEEPTEGLIEHVDEAINIMSDEVNMIFGLAAEDSHKVGFALHLMMAEYKITYKEILKEGGAVFKHLYAYTNNTLRRYWWTAHLRAFELSAKEAVVMAYEELDEVAEKQDDESCKDHDHFTNPIQEEECASV